MRRHCAAARLRRRRSSCRSGRINASLSRVQSVEHDPHIPLSKKLEIAMAEKNRVDRVAESTREFITSGEFDELPNRTEELQANEDAVDVPAPAQECDRAESERDAPEIENTEPDLETSAERKVRKPARASYAAVQNPDQPVVETWIPGHNRSRRIESTGRRAPSDFGI